MTDAVATPGDDDVTARTPSGVGLRWRIVGPVLLLVVLLDQWTKSLAREHLTYGGAARHVVPGVDLLLVRNTGVAFSMLADHRWAIVLVSALVVTALIIFVQRVPTTDTVTLLGIGLVAGGAIGNFIDRVRLHHVTDFIHVPNFPTFNVADAAITVGVGLIIVRMLFAGKS